MLRNVSVSDDEPYEYDDRIKHDLKMHYLEISPNRITMFLLDVLHVFKLKIRQAYYWPHCWSLATFSRQPLSLPLKRLYLALCSHNQSWLISRSHQNQ